MAMWPNKTTIDILMYLQSTRYLIVKNKLKPVLDNALKRLLVGLQEL